jgi:signal peptidase I
VKAATRKIARDYGIAIAAAVTVALLIRFFVIEAYRIPTSAMHPTLEPGDTIFVAKYPLGFNRKVERGDVLVFTSGSEPARDYIKRAIGLPGDTIEVRKGRVTLNGKPLSLPEEHKNAPCGREMIPGGRAYDVCWEPPINDDFGPEKVPEGSVFVLGDLRSQSPWDTKKHHSWGMVPLGAVRGKARWIWLSIEPHNVGMSPARFPNFRFDRMFRRIE